MGKLQMYLNRDQIGIVDSKIQLLLFPEDCYRPYSFKI